MTTDGAMGARRPLAPPAFLPVAGSRRFIHFPTSPRLFAAGVETPPEHCSAERCSAEGCSANCNQMFPSCRLRQGRRR